MNFEIHTNDDDTIDIRYQDERRPVADGRIAPDETRPGY